MMNKRKVTAIMISATLASVTLAGNVMAQNEYPTIDLFLAEQQCLVVQDLLLVH